MPTGRALDDPRSLLLGAGRRVIERDGAGALTSRSVTDESGVSKGVLHRHFDDFDAYLAELVAAEAARLRGLDPSGLDGDAPDDITELLVLAFTPTMLGLVNVTLTRDGVRRLVRQDGSTGIPLLTDVFDVVVQRLAAEQRAGRVRADADTSALALALVGSAHLLFAGELGALPDRSAVHEVVESILVGAMRATGGE